VRVVCAPLIKPFEVLLQKILTLQTIRVFSLSFSNFLFYSIVNVQPLRFIHGLLRAAVVAVADPSTVKVPCVVLVFLQRTNRTLIK